jgi:hypothetical protein
MGHADPDRYKRFSQFLSRHVAAFAAAAAAGYAAKGKGAVVYHASHDRFGELLAGLRLDYVTSAEIDAAARGGTRDELIQGILDRYEPPAEAVFVAIYPDRTYDVSRMLLGTGLRPPPLPPPG